MKNNQTLLKRIKTIAQNTPNCFLLKYENDDKISCHFYEPITLKLIQNLTNSKHTTSIENISESVKYSDGKWELNYSDYVPQDYPNSILLLQVSNLNDDGTISLDTGREKYITLEKHTKWKNSQIKSYDLVMAITGSTIGRTSIIPKNFSHANLNQALAKIVLKEKTLIRKNKVEINKKYVTMYLNSKFGHMQIKRYGGFRSGQGGLSTNEIKSVLIPLPSIERQNQIMSMLVDHSKNAINTEKKYLQKLNEMSNLLEKVFKQNISMKKQQHFIISGNKLDRIDCFYNSLTLKDFYEYLSKLERDKKISVSHGCNLLTYRKINKVNYESKKIQTFKYVDIENVDKELGVINGFEEDFLMNLPTRARQIIKEHDVLIPTPIGSTRAITIVPKDFDGHLCSTGFIIIENKTYDAALMLFGILKSRLMQEQFYYLQSGSIQPSMAVNTFKKSVQIPIPTKNIKKQFLYNLKNQIQDAKKLKKEHIQQLHDIENIFLREIDILVSETN